MGVWVNCRAGGRFVGANQQNLAQGPLIIQEGIAVYTSALWLYI